MTKKKQQIILTHGNYAPVDVAIAKGEVLVQHAEKAEDAALHTVLDDGATHVSFPSKEWVNAEIENLKAGEMNSAINGLDTRVDAIEKDYLKAADKNELNKAIGDEATARDNADNAINAKFGTGIGTGENEKTVAAAIAAEASAREDKDNALQEAIDAKVAQSVYDAKVAEIEGYVGGLQDVLEGYSEKGSVKAAVDSKVAQSVYDTKVAEIDGKLGGLQTAIDELDATYATNKELQDVKDELDADVLAAKTTLTTAEPEAGVKVVKTEAEDGHANYEVTAVGLATTKELDAVEERINTIVGQVEGDDGKSMRAVAKEEVDSFKNLLYGEGTADVIDTLQDVINWIDSDESGATKIVADIAELQKVTSGYTAENIIQTAINGLDTRVGAIEDDYLKAADKKAIEEKLGEGFSKDNTVAATIAAEADARTKADAAIEAKLGTGFDEVNTVAAAIAKEVKDREDAVKGVQDAIDALDSTYAKDAELAAAKTELQGEIAKAKTTLTTAEPEAGVKVTKSASDPNNYAIEAVGLAAQSTVNGIDTRLTTVEGTYVKEVVANDAAGNSIVSKEGSKITLDFSSFVIDGGEY